MIKHQELRGVREVREEQIRSIYRRYHIDVESTFTYEDAETFYRMFEDTDYTFFVPKYISASDFWFTIQEAKDVSADFETFQEMFERVAKVEIINDLELLERLRAIYYKYVIE